MMNYDYLEAVKADVLETIRNDYELTDYSDRDEAEQALNDALWIDDSVTGNASGSYTFNSAQAREYVEADPDTVREALREFCVSAEEVGNRFLDGDYEYLDVTARCYVLGQAINEALDEMEADGETPESWEE